MEAPLPAQYPGTRAAELFKTKILYLHQDIAKTEQRVEARTEHSEEIQVEIPPERAPAEAAVRSPQLTGP
jgi:hypothetical protein